MYTTFTSFLIVEKLVISYFCNKKVFQTVTPLLNAGTSAKLHNLHDKSFLCEFVYSSDSCWWPNNQRRVRNPKKTKLLTALEIFKIYFLLLLSIRVSFEQGRIDLNDYWMETSRCIFLSYYLKVNSMKSRISSNKHTQ
jgi:hypothetical protein